MSRSGRVSTASFHFHERNLTFFLLSCSSRLGSLQYIVQRREVVLWLASLCESMLFSRQTIYTSINYLDRVCTRVLVEGDKLPAFAAACALIASKMQDRKDDVLPTISDFVTLVGPGDRLPTSSSAPCAQFLSHPRTSSRCPLLLTAPLDPANMQQISIIAHSLCNK